MNSPAALPYREVWLVDFEFGAEPGERPAPRCLVAHELKSGRRLHIWEDELLVLRRCPYAIDDDALFVAFFASAEFGCHAALGWSLPINVLDLYVEFRVHTNGRELPAGNGLLGALTYYGIDGLDASEKDEMRQLAIRGGPWTVAERAALLAYCESDVVALLKLLPAMLPGIDLPRALLRGRYMPAVARMEHEGIPLDVLALERVRRAWPRIRLGITAEINAKFPVFEGETFKNDRFVRLLDERKIAWPRTASGRHALDDDTFKAMVKLHPDLSAVREARHALAQMRPESLDVGRDGRNRTLLSPYRSSTGRNQPSTSRFIFGLSTWIRSFIRPDPGAALLHADYSQQEWAIAAALSGDEMMMRAYAAGDAYLQFAIQAGAAPADATKKTHSKIRERFKVAGLGILYGMRELSIAGRIGQSEAHAAELLRLHKRLYHRYWGWSDAAVSHAMLRGELHTVFGWKVRPALPPNPRSLANFPVQANGAEMMRLAAIYMTEAGLNLCAPIHDAFLVHAPVERIERDARLMSAAMERASAIVLGGFPLRTDLKIIRYPERYADPRGDEMWELVVRLVGDLDVAS